jgi:hypothetical protein
MIPKPLSRRRLRLTLFGCRRGDRRKGRVRLSHTGPARPPAGAKISSRQTAKNAKNGGRRTVNTETTNGTNHTNKLDTRDRIRTIILRNVVFRARFWLWPTGEARGRAVSFVQFVVEKHFGYGLGARHRSLSSGGLCCLGHCRRGTPRARGRRACHVHRGRRGLPIDGYHHRTERSAASADPACLA